MGCVKNRAKDREVKTKAKMKRLESELKSIKENKRKNSNCAINNNTEKTQQDFEGNILKDIENKPIELVKYVNSAKETALILYKTIQAEGLDEKMPSTMTQLTKLQDYLYKISSSLSSMPKSIEIQQPLPQMSENKKIAELRKHVDLFKSKIAELEKQNEQDKNMMKKQFSDRLADYNKLIKEQNDELSKLRKMLDDSKNDLIIQKVFLDIVSKNNRN